MPVRLLKLTLDLLDFLRIPGRSATAYAQASRSGLQWSRHRSYSRDWSRRGRGHLNRCCGRDGGGGWSLGRCRRLCSSRGYLAVDLKTEALVVHNLSPIAHRNANIASVYNCVALFHYMPPNYFGVCRLSLIRAFSVCELLAWFTVRKEDCRLLCQLSAASATIVVVMSVNESLIVNEVLILPHLVSAVAIPRRCDSGRWLRC